MTAPSTPADGGQAAIIAAMKQARFYPEHPAQVEFRETHISAVFLAGPSVYKLKKSVRFAFLDTSALSRRFELCCEEIRLNRRLAPDVYLGVYAIVGSGSGCGLSTDPVTKPVPEALEYAVKMTRLPDQRMLDHMLANGAATPNTIAALAELLARFHRDAPREHATRYGSAGAVWRLIMGNLGECERFVGESIERAAFERLDQFFRHSLEAQWERINRRALGGYVVEGHGDLRAEHVYVGDGGQIAIIDCVEFSEQFRYGDTALEIAFLAMDLDRLGAPLLGDEFVARYVECAHDDELATLLPLYKCYRAVVRAKVASLKAIAPETSVAERERAQKLARRYFELAGGYAQTAAPALLVVCGRSGTGKSTVAKRIRYRTGFPVINSDVVRKQLAGVAPETSARSDYGAGIYDVETTRKTYSAMIEQARVSLAVGTGVILDATFKHAADREAVSDLARDLRAPLLFIECRASEQLTVARLEARSRRSGEVSDATVEIWRRQNADFEELSEIPAGNHMVVDTERDPGAIALEVGAALARSGI